MPFFYEPILARIVGYFEENFGELYRAIYSASEPEIIKAFAFSKKIAGLVLGWFAVVFLVELLLRIVLFVVRTVCHGTYRVIFGSKGSGSAKETASD